MQVIKETNIVLNQYLDIVHVKSSGSARCRIPQGQRSQRVNLLEIIVDNRNDISWEAQF